MVRRSSHLTVSVSSTVEISIKARKVTVKGPRGQVNKDFSHLPCEIEKLEQGAKKKKGPHLRIRMWFGGYKQACAVNTLKSHINNMIVGVTEGFMYKMRLVYAHFPINTVIPKDGSSVQIKNFLGGKHIKNIDMIKGVTVRNNADVKDELIFEGFDNAAVSLCCARVNQSVNVGDKDERKFLDGIFVSEKTLIAPKEAAE